MSATETQDDRCAGCGEERPGEICEPCMKLDQQSAARVRECCEHLSSASAAETPRRYAELLSAVVSIRMEQDALTRRQLEAK